MSKSKKVDMIKILMKAHKLGVKDAIELAARTNTSLVIYKDGKVQKVKPNFKYVRVPAKTPKKKLSARSNLSRKKSKK